MRMAIVDLDSTVAFVSWREALKSNSWYEYHSAAAQDKPCYSFIKTLNTLADNGVSVVGITNRPEKWRSLTNAWLMTNGVRFVYVMMRAEDDYSNVVDSTKKMIEDHFDEVKRHDVEFFISGREDVCRAVADAYGWTSLYVVNQSRHL